MSEERLNEIKDSVNFQRKLLLAHNMNTLCVNEEQELIEEINRLNNIIEELEKWCNECIDNRIIAREHGYNTISDTIFEIILDKLQALKENNK